ncbi:MAG: hypothetical protein ACR2N2_11630 [Acidimicrobiia bacterium]
MPDLLAENLAAMCGVWHDVLTARTPTGEVVTDDPFGGTPGPFPYENLVYIDLDGDRYTQTNVTFRGRPFHRRTFHATVDQGILTFDRLGPDAPTHIGIAAGPGRIWFLPDSIDDAWNRYSEPDYLVIDGDTRTRSTMLYRDGRFVRSLEVVGKRLTADTSRRVDLDPRGEGQPHEDKTTTHVFETPGAT